MRIGSRAQGAGAAALLIVVTAALPPRDARGGSVPRAPAPARRHVAGDRFTRTELYFGRARPDGPAVSDAEWQRFLDGTVTPCFPHGLTVLFGAGQFREAGGAIQHEDAIVLILVYPASSRTAEACVESIRGSYARTFQQRSVLRVDGDARVAF